jgi:hypothetical protein
MIQPRNFLTPDKQEQLPSAYNFFSRPREMDRIGLSNAGDAFLSQVFQFSSKDLKEEFIIQ